MTIEESVKNDATEFQKMLDTRTPEIQEAMNELSKKLDVIIGGAIKEYSEKTGAEVNMDDIPSYKTLNKIITGKIDELIRDHVKDKRKDL